MKMFADGKVSADTIAKSLGRSVKSVMKKASWLGLILSRKVTARQRGNDGDATTVWTPERDKELRALVLSANSVDTIAKV